MKLSETTKNYKKLSKLFGLLSVLCTVSPLVYFTVQAFIQGEVREKVTLGLSLTVCAILVALNTIKKRNLRSPVYLMILGIYACLDNLLSLFLIMAITTMADEFAFTPLHKSFKSKAIINKEIDRRG